VSEFTVLLLARLRMSYGFVTD